jgi:hypothetical protein
VRHTVLSVSERHSFFDAVQARLGTLLEADKVAAKAMNFIAQGNEFVFEEIHILANRG